LAGSSILNTPVAAMMLPDKSSDSDEKNPRNNDQACGASTHMFLKESHPGNIGYTLLHGPWCYCIALDEGKKGPWNNIYDKEDFVKMLAALKLRSEKIKAPSRAFFQHVSFFYCQS